MVRSKKTAAKAQSKKAVASKAKPAAKKAPAAKPANATLVTTKKAKASAAEPDRSSPAMAEVDAEVLEFIAAIDEFKQANGRPFPSWSEVLLVVRQLGYQRR